MENRNKLIPNITSEISLHELYQEKDNLADEIRNENIGNFLYGQFEEQTYKSRPNSEGSYIKK